jgi:hypothetical protein
VVHPEEVELIVLSVPIGDRGGEAPKSNHDDVAGMRALAALC